MEAGARERSRSDIAMIPLDRKIDVSSRFGPCNCSGLDEVAVDCLTDAVNVFGPCLSSAATQLRYRILSSACKRSSKSRQCLLGLSAVDHENPAGRHALSGVTQCLTSDQDTAHKKRLFNLGARGMKTSQTETKGGDEGEGEL